MVPRLDILFVGFDEFGVFNMAEPRSGYVQLIFSSMASLGLKGHRPAYLQITKAPTESRSSISVKEDIIRLNMKGQMIRFANFRVTVSKNTTLMRTRGLWKNVLPQVLKSVDLTPELVVGEGNASHYFTRPLCQTLGIPNVLRLHSIRGWYAPIIAKCSGEFTEVFKAPLSILHTVVLAHLSDHVITITEVERKALQKFMVKSVSTIEPTYVRKTQITEPKLLNKISFDIDKITARPFVLYVGRVTARKTPSAMALKLLLKVASLTPEVQFLVVGSNTDQIRAILGVSLNGLKNVLALGYINDYALEALYKKASIVLLPLPFLTGVSLRLIEALAYGKVIITTTIVASKLRNLRNGKHIIVEDNIKLYRDWIHNLINREECRKSLEDNAKQYFKTELSPAIHASRFEQLLFNIKGL